MDLKMEFQKIVDEFSGSQVAESKFVAEYAPRAIYAVQKGFIRVEENVVVPVSTSWGAWGSKTFSVGIKVGGGVSREVHKAIEARVKALVGQNYDTTYGTAWSCYGAKK